VRGLGRSRIVLVLLADSMLLVQWRRRQLWLCMAITVSQFARTRLNAQLISAWYIMWCLVHQRYIRGTSGALKPFIPTCHTDSHYRLSFYLCLQAGH
jgi:hypothetical protein